MFLCQVNDRTGLRLVESRHAAELFTLIDSNRDHLRRWHGWVDSIRAAHELTNSTGGSDFLPPLPQKSLPALQPA